MIGRCVTWVVFLLAAGFASSGFSEIVGAKNHTLGIATHVPPALIYVIDPQGKRAGMDPTAPVTPTGGGRVLNERANTEVSPQNIASDDPEDEGEGQATTMWEIGLFDTPAGEYIIVLKGLELGVSNMIHVDRWLIRQGNIPPAIKMQVFVEPGVERRLLVQFDPNRLDEEGVPFAEVHRVVTGADLVRDVESACRLGQITPDGVCQSLRAKAAAAAKALNKGRTRAARGAIKAFLNELEAQAEKHVKEPALTILREESEALLNPPQPLSKAKAKRRRGAKPKQ